MSRLVSNELPNRSGTHCMRRPFWETENSGSRWTAEETSKPTNLNVNALALYECVNIHLRLRGFHRHHFPRHSLSRKNIYVVARKIGGKKISNHKTTRKLNYCFSCMYNSACVSFHKPAKTFRFACSPQAVLVPLSLNYDLSKKKSDKISSYDFYNKNSLFMIATFIDISKTK